MRTLHSRAVAAAILATLSACSEDPPCGRRFYCALLFESPTSCGERIGTRIAAPPTRNPEGSIMFLTDPRDRCVGLLMPAGGYPPGYTDPAPWCNDDLLNDPGACP
jgi:hypothetical protein